MKVTSATVMNGRTISVELDSSEFQHTSGWESRPLPAKFAIISAQADFLVVGYLEDEEMISEDFAESRRRQIRERLNASI